MEVEGGWVVGWCELKEEHTEGWVEKRKRSGGKVMM